jgi:hypothetical protein
LISRERAAPGGGNVGEPRGGRRRRRFALGGVGANTGIGIAYGKRGVSRIVASVVAVAGIYAAHWTLTWFAAVALANAEPDSFECWGRALPNGGCRAAWGGWSVAMYLPELALAVFAVSAAASRSFRVWKWGLGAAFASVGVFFVVVASTHLWPLNQMPVIWPSLPA